MAFTVLIPQISAELRRNLPKTRVYEKFKDRLGSAIGPLRGWWRFTTRNLEATVRQHTPLHRAHEVLWRRSRMWRSRSIPRQRSSRPSITTQWMLTGKSGFHDLLRHVGVFSRKKCRALFNDRRLDNDGVALPFMLYGQGRRRSQPSPCQATR